MQRIIATINSGETGPQVANLQDALFALLARDKIWLLDASNRPTPGERERLTEGLKQERAQSLFGEITARLVRDFQLQQRLSDNLRGVVEDTTAAKLNELLRSIGALDGDTSMIVRGTVTTADDQPIRGASVIAFDRDLRKLQQFAKTETNERGEFTMSYDAAKFASGDVPSAPTPKLIVRAFVGNRQIGDDVSRPHPTRDEVVDFKTLAPVVSEWEKLSTGIMPLLEGQGEKDQLLPPWEVNDGDLDFIAEETGLDREHIRLWARAVTVGRDASEFMQPATVTPVVTDDLSAFAIFYGWFRQGLPTDWEALRLQRISTLRKTLLDAIDQSIIPGKLREDVENILARIPNLQIRELATLLGVTALPPDKVRVVLAQADGVDSVSDEMLARLVEQKTLAAHEAQFVGLSISLHRLAGGEESLVSAMLDSEFASVNTGKLQHARDLASLEPEDWERVLERAGSPAPGGVTRAQYARGLAMEAVGSFPHAAFVQRATRVPAEMPDELKTIQPLLERNKDAVITDFDALDLAGISNGEREALRDAQASLRRFSNLHPGLGLAELFSKQDSSPEVAKVAEERVGWLSTVFELNPDVSFLNLDFLPDSAGLKAVKFGSLSEDARARVLADLKAHQRVFSVAKNAIPAQEIMKAGFHSASAIALARAPDFAEKTGLPEREARAYRATALEVANEAALHYHRLYDIARDKATTPIRVIPSLAEFFEPLKGFAELISDQPWCACAHCQSVLSPAAYFVDLMYYVEQNILVDSFKGQEKHPLHLQVLRPDLWELELTCKNTDEYVPYLDVVNEILERYLTETVSLTVGTTVYKHLAAQEGSFKQPFTLPIERLEILLGHFGLSRYDVAKAMGSSRTIQLRARLKISQKEYDLITIERTTTGDLPFFKRGIQLFTVTLQLCNGIKERSRSTQNSQSGK
jgi:antitoxin component HigA of HigAB toxin-antitoxin module